MPHEPRIFPRCLAHTLQEQILARTRRARGTQRAQALAAFTDAGAEEEEEEEGIK